MIESTPPESGWILTESLTYIRMPYYGFQTIESLKANLKVDANQIKVLFEQQFHTTKEAFKVKLSLTKLE